MKDKKEECSTLEELKSKYESLMKKYNLPSFKEMDEEFEIGKLYDHESYTLLRDVRKVIMDKIIAYFRFLEALINPSAAPLFFLSLTKGVNPDDRKIIDEVYSKLGEFEIEVVSLDNNYSEKSEADFIKRAYKEWQDIKKKMDIISDALKRSWKQKFNKKERSYFG